MADVFNQMAIHWRGKDWTFTPSNRILRGIEGSLSPSSLTDVVQRMTAGKPPISETAFILSKFLEAAGAEGDDADEDLIYAEIMRDFEVNNGKGFVRVCKAVVQAISPSEETAKKLSAGSDSGNRAARRSKSAKARKKKTPASDGD